MVTVEELDDDLENEVTDECSKYGTVEKVVIYQEHQEDQQIIIKLFGLFSNSDGMSALCFALVVCIIDSLV